MTTPIGGQPATTSPLLGGGSTERSSKNQMDKDTFLKLLVAQMKYQDPSNPTDGAQFLAQTAQFTMVEKLADVNTAQHDLLTAQQFFGASSLVGQTVSYLNANGIEATGVVTSANFSGATASLKVGDTDVPLTAIRQVRRSQ